jgi:choice-of-anchor A domain-containing protein
MQSNSDVQGRVAVAGNATYSSFGVGASLNPNPNRIDLTVGGNLNITNSQVSNGSVYVGGTLTKSNVGVPHGTIQTGGPSPIDFTAAGVFLDTISQTWGGINANSTVTYGSGGVLSLQGNARSNLNVFSISALDLSNASTLNIVASSAATVLINVTGCVSTANKGCTANLQYLGMTLQGISGQNVLFNFVQAKSISMTGLSLQASILAPLAALGFNNGNVYGNVIARSFNGNGQINYAPFLGDFGYYDYDTPEPSSLLLFGGGMAALLARRMRRGRHAMLNGK